MKELHLHISFAPPILWYENVRSIYLSLNSILNTRTKHVKIDFHFVRKLVVSKRLHYDQAPLYKLKFLSDKLVATVQNAD